jgi:colicin import membrane protein
MKTGVAVSAVSHAALLAIVLMGFGSAKELQPQTVESISVDLVPVTDVASIRAGTLKSDVVETETPSIVKDDKPAELAQPTGNTEKDQPKPEATATPTPAPTTNAAPEPQPDPVPDPAPRPAAQPAPANPAPRPEPQPEAPAAPPPPAEPAPAPKPDPQPVNPAPELATPTEAPTPQDVAPQPAVRVANLEEKRAAFAKQQEAKRKADAEAKKKAEEDAKKKADEEKQRQAAEEKRVAEAKEAKEKAQREAEAKQQKQASLPTPDEISDIINQNDSRGAVTGSGGEPTLGKPTGTAATLSQSDLSALVARIKSCLNTPLGAREAGAKANLTIRFNPDGSVKGTPDITEMGVSPMDLTWANASVKAVMTCAPYPLVAEKYDQLNEIAVLFDATKD